MATPLQDEQADRVLGRALRWLTLVAALLVLVPTGAARAQGPGSGNTPSASAGEVTLEVERFGLRDYARPGEIACVRVVALDQSVKPREVLLRIEGRDADGDTPYFERQVVLNPNVKQGIWLYPLIPRNFGTTDTLQISAFEVDTGGEASESAADDSLVPAPASSRSVGRLLGSTLIAMKAQLAPYDAAIGIVGTGGANYGLADYGITDAQYSTSGHEIIQVMEGIRTTDLPDRWMGYAGIDAMVWGAGDPLEVRGERAAAIREWINRGGHLVVILPVAGQSWTSAGANELAELLPAVTITRNEGVDLSIYEKLLTRRKNARFPRDAVVYTFEPIAGAAPTDAIKVLAGPEGRCVVARRLVGTGAVTLIGLDLNHRMLAAQDIINADAFWNRVIGRRGMVRSATELAALAGNNSALVNREDKLFETDIGPSIAKSGRSAAGLLLALVVFALYWVVAGPGGFAFLKRTGLVRHAWVGFFAAAGVFTAIAWGGALILRPSRVEVGHLTILDHVYGQPVQRARSWMSVLIPWYGQATMEVGEPPKAGELAGRGGGDVLLPWTSPEQAQAGQDIFPDARGYSIQTRSPRSLTVPTRSTVKQLRADWSGGPAWKMIRPVASESDPAGGALTLAEGRRMTGLLVHELPGPLHDVDIIIVQPQKPLGFSIGSSLISRAFAFSLASDDPWEPGEVLDLSAVTSPSPGRPDAAEEYFNQLLGQGSTIDLTQPTSTARSAGGVTKRLAALGFFSQFEPPEFSQTIDYARKPVARRAETHGWDLGRWFTQPCVIVIGHLGTEKNPMPSAIPMWIDGEPVTPMGHTVVRWIYPLPDSPPPYQADNAPAEPDPAAVPAQDGRG
ncbi:MAG: hypothetical protein AMXMBFR58_10430 [Phycisphaerae bacterium]